MNLTKDMKIKLDKIIISVIFIVCILSIFMFIYVARNTTIETYTKQGVIKNQYTWSELKPKPHTDDQGNVVYWTYENVRYYSTVISLIDSNDVIEIRTESAYRKYKEGNLVTIQIHEYFYKGEPFHINYEVY